MQPILLETEPKLLLDKYKNKRLSSSAPIKHKGLYLAKPHARLVWEAVKDLIVKSKMFKFALNKNFYWLDDEYSYGVLKFTKIIRLSPKKFNELRSRHKITNEEKLKWWKTLNKILYGYEFEIIEKFDKPRKIDIPKEAQTFVNNIIFLSEVTKKLIKDIAEYNPSKLSNVVLNDDMRIAFIWYSRKKSGKKMKYSVEDIVNVAKLIYDEITKRVKKGEMKYEFEPEEMEPLSKELFKIISKGVLNELSEIHATIKGLSSILNEFKDFQIINNFVSIVGSTVKSQVEHMPNDIDLHIRMTEPNSYLKQAIEMRILKMLPEELAEKIHFIWGDSEGSHDSFCPLYHLTLIRAKPDIIEMSKSESITPLKPFKPMKSSASLGNTLFYKIEDAVAKLIPLKKPLIVEKKYDGFHIFLHKKRNEVKIFTEENTDITKSFPKLVKESKELSIFDFIIEGELIPYTPDGKTLGRVPLIKYVTGKKPEAMEKIILHVWDLLYFKDKPLTSLELYERKKALNTLSFTTHIVKVQPIVARNEEELISAISKFSKQEGSEGAMIKYWDAPYKPDSTTRTYIKCKIQQKVFAVVLDRIESSATTQVYSVGIFIPSEAIDKILDKKLIDFDKKKVMKLGNTFLTSIDASKGDILELGIEEIWRHKQTDTGKIYWSMHKPRVIAKTDKKDTSSHKDLDNLAVSGGQEVSFSGEFEELSEVPKGEGETRSEAAVRAWKNNWHLMYPKSGKGRFTVHRHWRGLTEEESKLPESELFKTDRSVHDDLRCQHDSNDAWGFTIFLGATKDNPWPNDKLIALSKSHKPEDKLRGHPKLRIPIAWLDVAKRKPAVSEPGGVGATSEKYAKFFVADHGTYEIGVWREHYMELFLDGKSIKGRCNIAFVPTGGERMWMVDFPKDQTPYAQTHKKEDVIKELHGKGQKWLIWRDPTSDKLPEKINVKKEIPD